MENSNNNTVDRRLENVVIGFKITSYDETKRRCNLSVTVKDNKGGSQTKNFKSVYVSALLNHKLLSDDERNDHYAIGKYYESTVPSQEWKENPLQLIKYNDTEGNVKYLLACVNERPALRKEVEDPLGGTMIDVTYRYHKKQNYKRYRNYAKPQQAAA